MVLFLNTYLEGPVNFNWINRVPQYHQAQSQALEIYVSAYQISRNQMIHISSVSTTSIISLLLINKYIYIDYYK
jgi:hypothetical protein